MHETVVSVENATNMVEFLAGRVVGHRIHQLYMNTAGIGLAPALKQYLMTNYQYETCEIIENK